MSDTDDSSSTTSNMALEAENNLALGRSQLEKSRPGSREYEVARGLIAASETFLAQVSHRDGA